MQGPSQSPQRVERQNPVEMRQTPGKGATKFCLRKLSGWRSCRRQLSLEGSSWRDHQTLPICRAKFTIGCAGRKSPCSHMGIMNCCGISKGVVTLPVISSCVWKQLGGACWISEEIHCARISWSDRWRRSRRVPLWCVTVSIRLRRTWSGMKLVLLTRSCQFWQKCLACKMSWGWQAAMNSSRRCGRSLC